MTQLEIPNIDILTQPSFVATLLVKVEIKQF